MNYSFSLSTFTPVLLFAIVMAVIAVVVRRTTPERMMIGLPAVIQWSSIGFGTLWLGRALIDIVKTLFSERVPVRIEVSPFWPKIPAEVTVQRGTATVDTLGINDGFSQAAAHVTGLSTAARSLIAVDIAMNALAVVLLCVIVARVAYEVRTGDIFTSRRIAELRYSGITFFTLGIAALVANGYAQSLILAEARPRFVTWSEPIWTAPAESLATQVFGIVQWSWSVSAPSWVFVAAVVTLTASMVLKRGSDIASDTEGLI